MKIPFHDYFKDLKPSVRLLVSLKDLKPSVMFYYEMLFLCPIGFDLDFFLAFLIIDCSSTRF